MNPLFNSQNNSNGVLGLLKAAKNPAAAMSMLSGNPMMKQVMEMCNGKDPQQVFLAECKKRGVNPQEILDLFR